MTVCAACPAWSERSNQRCNLNRGNESRKRDFGYMVWRGVFESYSFAESIGMGVGWGIWVIFCGWGLLWGV
jgi:hypothetical protein